MPPGFDSEWAEWPRNSMKKWVRRVEDTGKNEDVALRTPLNEEGDGEDDSGLMDTATKESPALLLRFQCCETNPEEPRIWIAFSIL